MKIPSVRLIKELCSAFITGRNIRGYKNITVFLFALYDFKAVKALLFVARQLIDTKNNRTIRRAISYLIDEALDIVPVSLGYDLNIGAFIRDSSIYSVL